MDRRRFLTTAAVAGGTAAAYSLLPPSLARARELPAPTGGLEVVKHVVIFMQENRSFDHYFGKLRGVRGFADRNAITLNKNGRSVFYQPTSTGGYVLPYGTDNHNLGGTPHGWTDGHDAWNKGRYDNWVPAKGNHTMCYYDRADIPFYYQLADAFTICDAYHCSVMGATSPNRSYHISGMIGYEPDGTRAIGNAAYNEDGHAGYTWKTYPERLETAGKSWQVYHEWDNFQDNNVEFYKVFRDIARKALAPQSLKSMDTFYGKVRAASGATRDALLAKLEDGVRTLTAAERSLFERGLRRVPKGELSATFRAAVAADALPAVSWLVAPTDQCEHPASDGPSTGSALVWDALDALASNEAVWNKTVFLLNYDENDGYFDHVPPPVPPSSETTEYHNGVPIGPGPRVPLLVVSPWSRGGNVCSEFSDHTSVLKFLEKATGVQETNISTWRRQLCGDLTATLDTTTSNPYPGFTRPVPTAGTGPKFPAPPNPQTFPQQESGTRTKRKLPYQPKVNTRQEKSTGRVWIDMVNQGTVKTHFAVYANAHRTDGPWRYNVAAGATVPDYFSVQTYGGGKYNLSCYGPNGFSHHLTGDLNAAGVTAEVVAATTTAEDGMVILTFKNTGASSVTFTVRVNAYRTGGPWTYPVLAGGTVTDTWHAGWYGNRWYDLTATVSSDPSFSRRFRGYIENGTDGVSG